MYFGRTCATSACASPAGIPGESPARRHLARCRDSCPGRVTASLRSSWATDHVLNARSSTDDESRSTRVDETAFSSFPDFGSPLKRKIPQRLSRAEAVRSASATPRYVFRAVAEGRSSFAIGCRDARPGCWPAQPDRIALARRRTLRIVMLRTESKLAPVSPTDVPIHSDHSGFKLCSNYSSVIF